jgi:hypothetical protein
MARARSSAERWPGGELARASSPMSRHPREWRGGWAPWPTPTCGSGAAVNRSVTAITGLTEPARLLKPTGNRPLTVPTKPSFSANRSVYRSGFVEFENRYCIGFLNPGAGRFLPFFGAAPSSTKNYNARLLLWQRAEADMGRGNT